MTLISFCKTPSMTGIIECRRPRWIGHTARIGGDKECIGNFGTEITWRVGTLMIKKEVVG
jgi:hypothetical protein